jgi:uncharacterized membrane protein YfcA
MLPFGIAGVVAGNFLAKRSSCTFLQEIFSCFVIFVGLKMADWSILPVLSIQQGMHYWLLCATAVVAGGGSRLLGTGGGLVTVPVLIYAGLIQHQALITSLSLNIPIMLFGAGLNFWGKSFPWKELRLLIPGAACGASIGAYVSYMYIPDKLLQALFGGLLVVSAIITLFPLVKARMHAFHTRPQQRQV